MKKWAITIVAILTFLTILDAVTTHWFTLLGYREVNPILALLAGTWWLFPAMIFPVAALGLLTIWSVRWVWEIPTKILIALLIGGIVLELFLIINNGVLIAKGWSFLGLMGF